MIDLPPPARSPDRLLLGPGPSNVDRRVLDAMSQPTPGHLDPVLLRVLDEICAMLRVVFDTENELTFPLSGTGSAGMEAALVNVLEPGDAAVIFANGVFGVRMADIAERAGADVAIVEVEWGKPVEPEQVETTLASHPDARIVAVVHAETSTGTRSDIAAVGRVVRAAAPEALFVVDAVTSIAGIALHVDAWDVDVCYAGTQKCLSAPPGLAPITFSSGALDRIENRKSKPQSWYLDVGLISGYLDAETRRYHHTAPTASLLGLHEGLRIVLEEGLEARERRHTDAGALLQSELVDRGFELFATEGYRLPQLTAALLPEGVDDAGVRRQLLERFDIEVGAGLGPVAGKLWRIGLMGVNARREVVSEFLDALDVLL